MRTAEARERARRAAHFNAFIRLSDEDGERSVAVKDIVDVAGLPTSCGAPIDAPPAESDAPVIRAVRAAGYGIVGKTNMHEWSAGISSANRTFGHVVNPRDPSRIPGGSSGGSAAAVNLGLCDWAIGSDTGGSIRIPAAFCGTVGFKPTVGAISTEGTVGMSSTMDCLGPIATSVELVEHAFSVMTGQRAAFAHVSPGRHDGLCVPANWPLADDEDTSEVWRDVSSGLPAVELPPVDEFDAVQQVVVRYEGARLHAARLRDHPEHFDDDVFAFLRSGLDISDDAYASARVRRSELIAAVKDAMRGWSALLMPTSPRIAPLRDTFAPEDMGAANRLTRPFNVTGQPALTIPVPDSPVSLQLVGWWRLDSALLGIGRDFESTLARRFGATTPKEISA